MSYKNDHYLTISNKYSSASSKAKAQLFETYDQLRDLVVSGSTGTGSGFGMAGNFLWQLARLISPSSFMTTLGGQQSMNIAGTSYWSPITGSITDESGVSSAFGIGSLGNYPGFPGYAAPISWGGTDVEITGYASGVTLANDLSNMAGAMSAAGYTGGVASGFGITNSNWVLPIAGLISGWGGIMTSAAPYLDALGLPAAVMGNLMQGTSSAALSAYQNVTGNIQSNADTILSNRVKNIETVVKMLDTQNDVVKKMLKEGLEGDKKNVEQNLAQ